jgi:zinc transporter, ZIP family
MLVLLLAATATAVATGIGAIPVVLMGARAASLRPLLMGLAAGVMLIAASLGLIVPALSLGSLLQVIAGILIGIVFLFAARGLITRDNRRAHRLDARGTSVLVFLVLFVHSLPEGFAVGTAYAEDPATIGLFVVLAISIQNIPEGTSVAIPLAAEGASATRQIGAAILSSAPQPIGAVIAYLLVEQIAWLLPISFGFAAGAMLTLALAEVAPQAVRENRRLASIGILAGVVVMVALDSLLRI